MVELYKDEYMQIFPMLVENLVSIGKGLIESTWNVTIILAKFYLLTALFRLESFDREGLDEVLLDESRIVLGLFLALGFVLYLAGISIDPLVPRIVSEGLAVAYLGYLFWRY